MNRKFILATLAIAVIAMFALVGCGGDDKDAASSAPASSSSAQEEAKAPADWYKAVIDDEAVKKDYPFYRLLDINGDGVDELFVSSTENSFIGAEDQAALYAYVNGEPKEIKKIGGAGGEVFAFNQAEKLFFYYSRLSGEEHVVQYTFENGELKEVQTADEYDQNHDPNEEGNTEDTYYLGGKKVAETEFEPFWNLYDDASEKLTYSKDGKGTPVADDDDGGNDTDDGNDD